MKFKNGSEIENIKTTDTIRGKRSELVSFYCVGCKKMHIDYPVRNIIILNENDVICKEQAKNHEAI